ncbi:adhesion G protein-coupled receptor G3-like isoform X1 [Nerophis ophidion]|uniref:adhesion G protein-coupled receptor G3-like isoform X1 n=1 Tax=Nerophis ophidion TaxID=159077 RepID=UPI002ADF1DF6|nr:adhesion G protein-coupled receptor G3-like isoform X1 [Nerophis ophidion]
MPRCGLRACETPACHQSATDDQMAHTATWPLLLLWLVCLCCHADGDSTTNYPRPKTVVSPRCENVLENCLSGNLSWTRCYKQHIVRCTLTGRGKPGFIFLEVETSNKVEVRPTADHDVRMPSSALQRAASGERSGRVVVVVVVVVTVLDSKHFQTSRRKRGRRVGATHTVLGDTVLVVQAGSSTLKNLSQPVVMSFKHNNTVREGRCVFWEESAQEEGTGSWSSDGCDTNDTGSHFVCRCNHLSFFAVLVNADVSLSKEDAVNLSLLTMVGSSLSAFFSALSLFLYVCLHKQPPERGGCLHAHLTLALLCLHLGFLACSLGARGPDWSCGVLGLLLHWALMATVTWSALEGFHLYLLLVRVFNIYIRRYLLKLSLLGWGLPTLVSLVCAVFQVYGKYQLQFPDANNQTFTLQICWMRSEWAPIKTVILVTSVVFPSLVVLFNSCMLALVLFKLRTGGGWQKKAKGGRGRLWKDSVSVLGLSCLLGLPWGLLSATYVSLAGIYLFTALNSMQGVFVFLWSLALTCKSSSDTSSSSGDTSSQRIITTSFNN